MCYPSERSQDVSFLNATEVAREAGIHDPVKCWSAYGGDATGIPGDKAEVFNVVLVTKVVRKEFVDTQMVILWKWCPNVRRVQEPRRSSSFQHCITSRDVQSGVSLLK